jgi:transcription initiation factor IIF auxiliary subunit
MARQGSEIDSDAKVNADRLESELEALQSRLRESIGPLGVFWNHVKEVNGLFRSLKPLLAEDRQRLWAQLDRICAQAKEREAENKKQWENRKSISANKRSLVESKIHDAYFQAKGGSSAQELAKAGELLKTAMEWMNNGWSGFNIPTQLFAFDDGKMTKADHDACWERWREANEMLHSRRQELGENNFSHFQSEAEDAIGIATYDPKRAKEKVQTIQKAMHGTIMNADQFSEIKRLLDKAWGHASNKQEERHGEWLGRMRSHIDRKRELINQMEEIIERIEAEIDHCRDLAANARTSDFENSVNESIERKYNVISEKRRFIRELV